MTGELILQVILALVTGGAIYGGIRADLKGIHQRVTAQEAALSEAHKRLDRHIDRRAHDE
ncbi:MAG: hypothetical protein V4563_15040 [Pseudomonadota bacterium]